MYINKEQLDSRLEGQKRINVRTPHERKLQGTRTLTHEERVLFAALSETDSQANVAREFGVSPATISNVARGLDASKRLDKDLIEDTAKAVVPLKEEISNKALNVLMTSLGVVESKVKGVKTASEASVVAKNMANVASQLAPPVAPSTNNGPKILININGPKTKEESDYEVIEVPAL